MNYSFNSREVEFRTPEEMTDDSRFAVKRLSGINFYLTDIRLIRERVHCIEDSEYTVRSEYNRNAGQKIDELIKRLIEAEASERYKNVS